MNSISNTVNSFLETYDLKDKTLCLGFSGGYDSMCLLHILYKLGCDVVAVHLNHNWRGEESRQEEQNCNDFCKKYGIKFYSEVLPENIPHTETAARDARYKFFYRAMEKFNSVAFLTAHNADDNAETVIYRIIKGTGIDGLAAISQKRDCFYRPLLGVRRSEIEDYCRENELTPNNDSSNENTKYKRNLIRHKIFPLFSDINPNFVDAINSLSELAACDTDFLTSSTSEFVNFPKSLRGRIVRNLLIKYNLEYDREKIENLSQFIEENSTSKSGRKCSLTSGLWLYVNSEKFEVVKEVPKYNAELEINREGTFEFGEYVFEVEKCNILPKKFPKDSDCVAYINVDKLDFTLRTRRDGDIIQPLGCSGTQKLKKYLNEKKISSFEKDMIPLLCKNQDVLWVPGYGLSEKVKVLDGKVSHVIRLVKKVVCNED